MAVAPRVRAARHAVLSVFMLHAMIVSTRSEATHELNAHVKRHSASTDRDLVILLSLDGLRTDYLTRPDELGLRIPTLRKLIERGTLASGMDCVTPAMTYPGHTTMITGVHPQRHGVLANSKFDPEKKGEGSFFFASDVRVQSLFQAVQDQVEDPLVAAVSWPASAGAAVDYTVPDAFGRDPQERKYLFDGFVKGPVSAVVPDAEALVKVNDPERMNLTHTFLRQHARKRANGHARRWPDFLAAHWISFDGAQHADGVFSDRALRTLEGMDAELGRVLQTIESIGAGDRFSLLIVGDHGFVNVTKTLQIGVLLAAEGLVFPNTPKKWRAAPYAASGSLAIYLKDPNDADAKAKLDKIFEYVVDNGYGVDRIRFGAEIPETGGFPGAYALLTPKDDWQLTGGLQGSLVLESAKPSGVHGHVAGPRELQAGFLAVGPGIRRGHTMGKVHLVDVAPTLARLLDVKLQHETDGRVLDEIFTS